METALLKLWATVSGLAKVAIFTANVDAENQTLINHKCVCGALNRHFCQTRVIGSVFLYLYAFQFAYCPLVMISKIRLFLFSINSKVWSLYCLYSSIVCGNGGLLKLSNGKENSICSFWSIKSCK